MMLAMQLAYVEVSKDFIYPYFSMYYWTHMFLSQILRLRCSSLVPFISYFFPIHVRIASQIASCWGRPNSRMK
jgi:hypothetical protein